MVKVALFVRLEAKPAKRKRWRASFWAVFPRHGRARNHRLVWHSPRANTFGIFDAFPMKRAGKRNLSGKVAAALMAKAGELFSEPPSIEKVDVLAAKLPG